jgi:hypothetical protein
MSEAMLSIGCKNRKLNSRAVQAVKRINGSCPGCTIALEQQTDNSEGAPLNIFILHKRA